MLTAVKQMLLAGDAYRAGGEISPAKWASLSERTRKCLTRTRLVRSTDLSPVARTASPPVASTTPLRAGGRSRGRKPKKES